MKFKTLKLFKPYLEAVLDVGFISLRTRVMHESWCQDVYDYILLDWRFLKWNGSFRLYRPGYTRWGAK